MAIVELGVLTPLHTIMETCSKDTIAAAVAALRNLSIHRRNEVSTYSSLLGPFHKACKHKHLLSTKSNLSIHRRNEVSTRLLGP